MDWSSNSSDLNSIENVWAALKKEICNDKIITTKRDLIENIIKPWHNTPALEEIAKKCIASMPQHIQNVIARKGGFTKYENCICIIEFVLS